METPIFVPSLPHPVDRVAKLLRTLSQVLLLATLVLMVLFFIPGTMGLALFPKVYLVLFGCLATLLFASLATLRTGAVTIKFTPLVTSWWLLVVTGILSALLAPNLLSSLFGEMLEIHTVGFLGLLGLVISLLSVVGNSKKFVLYLYGSFVVSAFIVAIIFLIRVFAGVNTLPVPLLQVLTDNYIGSFNDLGILLGGMVMVGLVALAQLDLPKKGLLILSTLIVLALLVLANVNFFFVWLLIALFSLMLLMYVLTKDRFGVSVHAPAYHHPLPMGAVSIIGLVFLVSAVFLIGGTSLGTTLSNATGVNYIEIRPSLTATIDILQPVYADRTLTGIGPNRFAEAWNLHKNVSINETIFWNTPFTAGGGYIPTWFVTTGSLGVLAWVLFLGSFLYTGVRTLLMSKATDSFWFFIGSVSFVAGLFIWILSFVYVPGPTILLLGAVCTGVLVVSQQKIVPKSGRTFNLLSTSKTGFILIAGVMLCIISVLSVGYNASKQVVAVYLFNTATKNISAEDTNAFAIVTGKIAQAAALYPTDTYYRNLANYQYSYLSTLLAIAEPTTVEQQQIKNTVTAALTAGQQAVALKPTDALNWQMLADIYGGLALLNMEGAKERAFESYQKAESLDPKNPSYVLQKAAIESRTGNADEARRLAILALELKPNFTDALYLLSQLDIAAGDIAAAIAMTESIISIEANNPGRYYQLGVLYGALQNTDASIAAFTTAIDLNPSYANARYFRAQQYLIKGETELATRELEFVRDLSPDNVTVTDLINKIKSGEITAKTLTESQTIAENAEVITENDVTTTNTVPDSTLLTPVNTSGAKKTEEKSKITTDESSEFVQP